MDYSLWGCKELDVIKHACTASIPAWKIPWTEGPGGLQSMGLQRVGRDQACKHSRIPAWKIPWTEGPGGLQSKGLPRVGHD